MRALVFDSTLRLDPRRPEPQRADGDSLLRVRQAGICSTDLEICRGYMGFRGVLGHEFVADVLESPDPALVGKRVAGEINCVCARCDLCQAGLRSHCRDRTVVGIHRHDGAFADLLRLPAVNLHVLPDSVDDDMAVFVEPLAAACQVTRQINVGKDTYATVLGAGRLGLLVAQVLRNAGCPVRVIGRNTATLPLCERWQIKARPLADIAPRRDQDLVVDCTGSAEGFDLALRLVRPRGTVVLKSTVAAGKPLDLSPAVVDEITIVGSRCGPFREAIRLLAAREVDVLSLIHRRLKLDQAIEALDIAGRRGTLKVMLTM